MDSAADNGAGASAYIRQQIQQRGPLTLQAFFDLALYHPRYGYYVTHPVLGHHGDFTTAPETSQMFGEILGVWIQDVWRQLGRPPCLHLLELGPGKGTMMKDMLRVGEKNKSFFKALQVHLVEISASFQKIQQQTLSSFPFVRWHSTLETALSCVNGPFVGVANEFFDALAIEQYQKKEGQWHQRLVGWHALQQGFSWVLKPTPCLNVSSGASLPDALPLANTLPSDTISPAILPPPGHPILPLGHQGQGVGGGLVAPEAKEGDIWEISPQRDDVFCKLISCAQQHTGALWINDYGYCYQQTKRSLAGNAGVGDSLQGLFKKRPVHPLYAPGQTDLTSHVNFGRFEDIAQLYAMPSKGPLPQGVFLKNMGIDVRLEVLKKQKPFSVQGILSAQHARLTHPSQMGGVFQSYAVYFPSSLLMPGFF